MKDKIVRLENLPEKSDEKVIEELVKVKGIGPWTARCFLCFLSDAKTYSHMET